MANITITIEAASAEDLLLTLQKLAKDGKECMCQKPAPVQTAPFELSGLVASASTPAKAEASAEPVVEAKEPVEAEPEKPAPQQATQPQTDRPVETVTLETLSGVPYPELLDFCRRHPGANVNPEKNAATFFRDLVESRVKRYLESQAK